MNEAKDHPKTAWFAAQLLRAMVLGLIFVVSVSTCHADSPSGPVGAIVVKGNSFISTDAIKAVLRQKNGTPYSDATSESDRQAIQDMGYFSAVTLQTAAETDGSVTETYSVVENPRITSIVISGNTVFTTAKLLNLISSKTNSVLNTNTLSQDIQTIVGAYRDGGYRASISEDINIDPTTGVLTIPIIEARVTTIKISGNTKTRSHVITREFRTKPGSVYNEVLFKKDLTRVFNLGLFESVGPADISTPNVGEVALTVPVTEKRTGQVSVSLGYSATEGLVGIASLGETNFRGLGETANVSWTVGGAQAESSFEGSFGDPYIDKHHDGFDIDLYNRVVYRFDNSFLGSNDNSGNNSQYIERRIGGTLSVSRPVAEYSTAFLTGRAESVHTNDVNVPASDSFIRQNSDLGGLGTRLVTDTRDNNQAPAAGGFNSYSIEGVTANVSTIGNSPSPLAPGRYQFAKLGIDLRRYISLQGPRRKSITEQKRVLAFRFLGGYTPHEVPFSEQYFLGGADSLRGYDEDRFWGTNLVLLNSEIRIPVVSSVTGVLFTDSGDAWGSIYQGSGLEQHTNFELQSSVGVGVRVITPLGAIRVDYGVGSQGGKTDFSIGQSF